MYSAVWEMGEHMYSLLLPSDTINKKKVISKDSCLVVPVAKEMINATAA